MRGLKWIAAGVCVLSGLFSTVQANSMTPQQLQQQQQNQQALLLDVREADEFAAGHLQSAVHIPLAQIGAQISQLATDKTRPIYVYCRSGRRADLAKAELEKLGYHNVQNLGGYQQLKDAGFN
ncbi:phage shock protein E [Pasteurella testudinis DSM 23072]|uniref:Phage shock protein E n=1 Tax=Pasteurella testudinis DSM 23072 TaxID=1122938 RepID=A0A1W1ULN9_9PAST|nr:rhodanese-like domain-containing protein [Pasteurella testudinis]SMB81997.1 phage shock protein E [Pasteurella testudinis DSM 23072]SUB52390.1 putative rhodanese domain sulfurtransferase [Pasteurella testudinis]